MLNKLKTILLFLVPMISHATDNIETFKEKLDKLYINNATLEEKLQLFNSEFYKIFSYYDLLSFTVESALDEPIVLSKISAKALDDLKILAENIQEYYDNNTNDYNTVLEQMDRYLVAYGQNNEIIIAIAVMFLHFDQALANARKLVYQYVFGKHEDYLLFQKLLLAEDCEQNFEAELDKGLVPQGTRKDLLLGVMVKKVLKKHGFFAKLSKPRT